MRASAIVCAMVLAAIAACAKKECPAPPACPDCTKVTPPPAAVDAGTTPPAYDGYSFRLVEKEGKAAFVATSSKGRVVVIPLDPRTTMYADGKAGTAGELLMFAFSGGGCPCRLEACWPYCRVADPTLSMSKAELYGKPDVPDWPPVKELDANGVPVEGGTAPAPTPPAPTPPAPAPAPPQ